MRREKDMPAWIKYTISVFSDMHSAFPWLEQGGRTGETTGF